MYILNNCVVGYINLCVGEEKKNPTISLHVLKR
jgi:hypothetical protein